MLRTLLSFNGARELFLAVVFVGGSFFEGAYRVLPASRSPSVQHPTKKKKKKKEKKKKHNHLKRFLSNFQTRVETQLNKETSGSHWYRLRTRTIPLSACPLATRPFFNFNESIDSVHFAMTRVENV